MKDEIRDQLLALRDGRGPGDLVLIDAFLEELCQYPLCIKHGETRRQRTSYSDELSNWCCYCPEHHKENDAYWDSMWSEYYAGIQ